MGKELVMTDRNDLPNDELIDLGAASMETKGGGFIVADSLNSLQQPVGISDD